MYFYVGAVHSLIRLSGFSALLRRANLQTIRFN